MATSKQRFNRKKFTKEYKVKQIQKNITKRTRLKKQYLKALKEEGYSVPSKEQSSNSKKRDLNDNDDILNSNNDTVSISIRKKSVKDLKEEKRLAGKAKIDEKKRLKKEKLKKQREEREMRRQKELERIKLSKEKHLQREKRSKRLTQKTRTGQPLMGPKISDLLERIKKDDIYTK